MNKHLAACLLLGVVTTVAITTAPRDARAQEVASVRRQAGIGALVAGPLLSLGFGAATGAVFAVNPAPPPLGAWVVAGAFAAALQVAAVGMTVYGGIELARSRARSRPRAVATFTPFVVPYAERGGAGVVATWRF